MEHRAERIELQWRRVWVKLTLVGLNFDRSSYAMERSHSTELDSILRELKRFICAVRSMRFIRDRSMRSIDQAWYVPH